MAKLTADQLIEAFKDLTLIELSDFVKKFEEEFDVTAAAPAAVAVAAAPAAGGDAAGDAGAKDSYNVVLTNAGAGKIAVIKEVRGLTGLGLAEAKALVDEAPKTILENAKTADAENAKKVLEEAGATVELQ